MSNFNKIFGIIKKHHSESGPIVGEAQIQKIAADTNISLERLHFYLECLEQTGVILYSQENKSIDLTEKGLKAHRVFP